MVVILAANLHKIFENCKNNGFFLLSLASPFLLTHAIDLLALASVSYRRRALAFLKKNLYSVPHTTL
jgi:hypothetical protein